MLLTSKTLKVVFFYLKIKFVFVFLSFFISYWIVYGCQIPILALIALEFLCFLFPCGGVLGGQGLSWGRAPLFGGQWSFPWWCPLIGEPTV